MLKFVDARGSKFEAGQTVANTNFPGFTGKIVKQGENLCLETMEKDTKAARPELKITPLKEFASGIIKTADGVETYRVPGWEIKGKK